MVRSDTVKNAFARVILALLLGALTPAMAQEELVLIVGAHSHVEQLDSSVVRKLFLGLTVTQDGARLRPMLNESKPRIKDLFLQNIVSMSDNTYDRYLLRMSLMRGQTRPVVYKDVRRLIDAVAADPDAVSYAWSRDVVHDERIRILRVLWHD